MIDRTRDIQTRASSPVVALSEDESVADNREFFNLAGDCQQKLAMISQSVAKLSKLRHILYAATSPDVESHCMTDCGQQSNVLDALLHQTRSLLSSLAVDRQVSSVTESKIRGNMYTTLLRRFQSTIREYHSIKDDMLSMQKQKAVRLLKISSSEGLSDKEAHELIQRGITAADAMKVQIAANEEEMSLRKRLYAVTDKLEDLRRLEDSIKQLNSIFAEMSQLVFEQGELLDSIEYTVVNSKNYTNEARVSLTEAKRKQRAHMKLAICLLVTLFIIAGIFLIPRLIDNN